MKLADTDKKMPMSGEPCESMKDLNSRESGLLASEPLPAPPPQSQDLPYLLLDQLPVGVFHKDVEGRFVFVNSWFCRVKEITPEEYLGKTAEEIAAAKWTREDAGQPGTLAKIELLKSGEQHHRQIMETGRSIETEEVYKDASGKEHIVHVTKSVLIGPQGNVLGTQGMMLDITERKQAEGQLASERDMLRALMNSSTDAIYFKDRESRFRRCSESLFRRCQEALVGRDGQTPADVKVLSADSAIGKSDFDFFGPEHAQEAFNDEQEIIRTGRPMVDKTEKEIWKDGHVTWALTSKMPLYDDHGQTIGTFGISKDITAIKKAETQLEELHKQLLQTSRQAGMAEVATSVLHNVGNVLNSVNVSATLLLDNTKKSNVSYLTKAVSLLNDHISDASAYLSRNSNAPSPNWIHCAKTSSTSRKSWPCSRITPRFPAWPRRSKSLTWSRMPCA
jgi:PAS domain S-box-containing protein